MSRFRTQLPQTGHQLFLTDGGIETDLIFNEGVDLPHFASFTLLSGRAGQDRLRVYYRRYIEIARSCHAGFILESPTWRSSTEWGAKLGYDEAALAKANHEAILLMDELRREHESPALPIVVSGCIGPRGDGYDPGQIMNPGEARRYHAQQVSALAAAGADFVSALTMTNVNEAIGITQAARAMDVPVVISFTVETDGCLPTGQSIEEAIRQTDHATGHAPAYYMINCAHPDHFTEKLELGGQWLVRVRGIRANASRCSHAELNDATALDAGNPQELGIQYAELRRRYPHITVLGGCCGTDHRHLHEIAHACCAAA